MQENTAGGGRARGRYGGALLHSRRATNLLSSAGRAPGSGTLPARSRHPHSRRAAGAGGSDATLELRRRGQGPEGSGSGSEGAGRREGGRRDGAASRLQTLREGGRGGRRALGGERSPGRQRAGGRRERLGRGPGVLRAGRGAAGGTVGGDGGRGPVPGLTGVWGRAWPGPSGYLGPRPRKRALGAPRAPGEGLQRLPVLRAAARPLPLVSPAPGIDRCPLSASSSSPASFRYCFQSFISVLFA